MVEEYLIRRILYNAIRPEQMHYKVPLHGYVPQEVTMEPAEQKPQKVIDQYCKRKYNRYKSPLKV